MARYAAELKVFGAIAAAAVIVWAVNRKPHRPPRIPVWQPSGGEAPALPPVSPGCARPAPPAGFRSETLAIDGRERRFDMVVPPGIGPSHPAAVVFFFHGRRPRGTRAPVRGPAELAAAVRGEAVVVAPQGQYFEEEAATGWDLACEGGDMRFFDAMLARIEDAVCVDPRAVFAAGMSWGADMVESLACCRGDRLRAIAPASGAYMEANQRCPARRLPAVRLTYGQYEPYRREEFRAVMTFFRGVHRCDNGLVARAPCASYRGCAQPVVECWYEGMGHAMPPDYATATWAFFQSLIKP